MVLSKWGWAKSTPDSRINPVLGTPYSRKDSASRILAQSLWPSDPWAPLLLGRHHYLSVAIRGSPSVGCLSVAMLGQVTQFPRWLEYSGLPRQLTRRLGPGGWLVFKKLVELDCQRNLRPGTIEISLRELAMMTGLTITALRSTLKGLRQEELIHCYLPRHSQENGLFEITNPLTTPVSPRRIKREYGQLFGAQQDFFRYYDEEKEREVKDRTLKRVIELYFEHMGLKMNSLILDQLRLLRRRFRLSELEKAFERAHSTGVKQLGFVVQSLMHKEKKEVRRRASKKKKR